MDPLAKLESLQATLDQVGTTLDQALEQCMSSLNPKITIEHAIGTWQNHVMPVQKTVSEAVLEAICFYDQAWLQFAMLDDHPSSYKWRLGLRSDYLFGDESDVKRLPLLHIRWVKLLVPGALDEKPVVVELTEEGGFDEHVVQPHDWFDKTLGPTREDWESGWASLYEEALSCTKLRVENLRMARIALVMTAYGLPLDLPDDAFWHESEFSFQEPCTNAGKRRRSSIH